MKILVPLITHVVAVLDGRGLHPGDVRTMVRLREGAAGKDLALGDLGKPVGFLLLRSEVQDDLRGEIGQDEACADGGIAAAQFLGNQDVFHDAVSHARVFLREMDADKPEFGGFFPDIHGIFVLFVQLRDQVFLKFLFDKLPDRLLNAHLLSGQFKFHGAPPG